ncbi:MAG: FHA domain-containing protein [Firmicutes bacterium]|nr:FHA domain-containing protein [Bacillota bacterium]
MEKLVWWPVHMVFLGLLLAFLREAIRSITFGSDQEPTSPLAYLVELPVSGGEKPLQVWPIREKIRLGRGFGNDVVLDDPFVSINHARIYLDKKEYWLEDLGSTNCTYVNGELVSGPQRLRQVALITVGNAVVVFHTCSTSPVGKG